MKIIVTGGAGFIGSHIVDKLVARGDEVVVIDNLSTGKKENLNPKAKLYRISVADKKVEEIFRKEKPDYVIHQAAQVDVTRSVMEPIFDAEINILGGLNILECCRRYGVKKIVYGNSGGAGSGEPQYLPVDEKHPIEPLCPYGVSKHTLEHYLRIYSQIHGLRYVSLRYANVYGPRQDPFGEGGVIAIFSHKLLNDEPPKIFGDGKQTRDFVFVGDIADANIAALEKGENDFFNVATETEISINDLFRLIRQITGAKAEPIYAEARKGEIIRSVLSNKKIKKAIGWSPKVDLRQGLKLTVDSLRKKK